MKVAIALLACFAVSQAAFTGSLQQRIQPVVDQALFKVQLASGRNNFIQILISALKPHIDEVVSDIQTTMGNAHDAAAAHAQSLATSIQEISQVVGVNPSALVNALPASIQALINNLLNHNVDGKVDMTSAVAAIQAHFEQQTQNVNAAIAAMTEHAQNLASQLTMPNLMNWLLGQLQSRGWFSNVWGAITGAVGNVWDAATDHASNAWNAASTQALDAWNQLYGTASAVAGTAMDSASSMAAAFIAEAQNGANQMSADAAVHFGNFMSGFQDQLGEQYGQVQQAIAEILAGQNNNNAGKRF